MEYNEEVLLQLTEKGILYIAFYEALMDKLPQEELSMDLWNKFWNRYVELVGKENGV